MDHKRPHYDGLLTKALDPLELKADAERGVVSGYASKFWVVDSYGEAVAPGAFAKSIEERGPGGADRIIFRYEHAYTVGRHTSLKEDETGLAIEASISDDGMYGTALRRQLADGVTYGLSIGFRSLKRRPATEEDPLDFSSAPNWVLEWAKSDIANISILENTKLMENSAVTFPANDPAVIESYRSFDPDALHRLLADVQGGRMAPEQLPVLRQIAAALPADVAPEGRQADSTTRAADGTPPPVIRNRLAEARFALAAAGIAWETPTP